MSYLLTPILAALDLAETGMCITHDIDGYTPISPFELRMSRLTQDDIADLSISGRGEWLFALDDYAEARNSNELDVERSDNDEYAEEHTEVPRPDTPDYIRPQAQDNIPEESTPEDRTAEAEVLDRFNKTLAQYPESRRNDPTIINVAQKSAHWAYSYKHVRESLDDGTSPWTPLKPADNSFDWLFDGIEDMQYQSCRVKSVYCKWLKKKQRQTKWLEKKQLQNKLPKKAKLQIKWLKKHQLQSKLLQDKKLQVKWLILQKQLQKKLLKKKQPAQKLPEEYPSYHHLNFNNKPVDYKYMTPPAETFWLAFSPALRKRVNNDRRFCRTVVAAYAARFVDPCSYDPDLKIPFLTGTSLKEAVENWVRKVYYPLGCWIYDKEANADVVQSEKLHKKTLVYWNRPGVNKLPQLVTKPRRRRRDHEKRQPVQENSPLREVQNISEIDESIVLEKDTFLELTDPHVSFISNFTRGSGRNVSGVAGFLELTEPRLFSSKESYLDVSQSHDLAESRTVDCEMYMEQDMSTVPTPDLESTDEDSDDDAPFDSAQVFIEQLSQMLIPGMRVFETLEDESSFSRPIRPKSARGNYHDEHSVNLANPDSLDQIYLSTEIRALSDIEEEPYLGAERNNDGQEIQYQNPSMQGFDVYEDTQITSSGDIVDNISETGPDINPEADGEGYAKQVDTTTLSSDIEDGASRTLADSLGPIEALLSPPLTAQNKGCSDESIFVKPIEEVWPMENYSHDNTTLSNIGDAKLSVFSNGPTLMIEDTTGPERSEPSSPSSPSENQADTDDSAAGTETTIHSLATPIDSDEKGSSYAETQSQAPAEIVLVGGTVSIRYLAAVMKKNKAPLERLISYIWRNPWPLVFVLITGTERLFLGMMLVFGFMLMA